MLLKHVDHGGDGPPLVLLHAFPLDSGMFDRLVPLLAGTARVITVDLPGLGDSDTPVVEPSMCLVADGVFGVLDDLGIDAAVVLGISTGGYVALQMVDQAPGRVRGLVLASTTPHRIEPDVPADRVEVAAEVERLQSTGPVADSADEGIGATAHEEQPALVEKLRHVIADADPAGVAWLARAIAGRQDTAESLRAYEGPVLLLFGDEDGATPPSRGEEMLLLRGRKETTLAVLPRTGHLTPLESPHLVAAELMTFVRAVR